MNKVIGKMNKWSVLLLIALVGLGSCKDTPVTDDNQQDLIDEFEDYYEFQMIDLSEKEIDATVYLPDETAGIGAALKPVIEHGVGELKWDIKVGPKFHLLIEDQGNYTDLLEVKKKTLSQNKFFDVEYIVEDSVLLIYKKKLVVSGASASKEIGQEHESFHVYGQKIIDGITYEIRSNDNGYEERIINLMAKSIRSFNPKKK